MRRDGLQGDPRLIAGLRLHWLGRYWESHDVLEPVWRGAEGADRDAVKAAIQVGAAVIHAIWRDLSGAAAILERTLALLATLPPRHLGLDLVRLRVECEALRAEIGRVAAGERAEIDPALVPRLVPEGLDAEALMDDERYEIIWLKDGRNRFRLAGLPLPHDPE